MNGSQGRGLVYETAYNVLKQKTVHGAHMKLRDYEGSLASTPGMRFPPGVTFSQLVQNMETWGLVHVSGNNISLNSR